MSRRFVYNFFTPLQNPRSRRSASHIAWLVGVLLAAGSAHAPAARPGSFDMANLAPDAPAAQFRGDRDENSSASSAPQTTPEIPATGWFQNSTPDPLLSFAKRTAAAFNSSPPPPITPTHEPDDSGYISSLLNTASVAADSTASTGLASQTSQIAGSSPITTPIVGDSPASVTTGTPVPEPAAMWMITFAATLLRGRRSQSHR